MSFEAVLADRERLDEVGSRDPVPVSIESLSKRVFEMRGRCYQLVRPSGQRADVEADLVGEEANLLRSTAFDGLPLRVDDPPRFGIVGALGIEDFVESDDQLGKLSGSVFFFTNR